MGDTGPGDPTADDELRMLRARAYGPSADIHTDAAALRRLRELEAAAPVEADAPDADDPQIDGLPSAPARIDGGEPAQPADSPPVRNRVRRGVVAIAVAAALAVGMGLGALWTASTAPAQHPSADAQPAVTVAPDRAFSWPSFYPEGGSARAIGFRDLAGITVVAVPPSSAAARSWCIATYETARLDPTSNEYDCDSEKACAAGPFPAAVVIDMARAPRSLREAFPGASALQLVLDPDPLRILVYDRPAAE